MLTFSFVSRSTLIRVLVALFPAVLHCVMHQGLGTVVEFVKCVYKQLNILHAVNSKSFTNSINLHFKHLILRNCLTVLASLSGLIVDQKLSLLNE